MPLTSDDAAAQARKPIPEPDPQSAEFWASARAHRLTIQYCTGCEFYIHTPRTACPRCDNTELDHREVSGRGTLYSYTVMHDAPAPAFASMLPYVVGVVELREQERLLIVGNIVGCPVPSLRLGMPVSVAFEDMTTGTPEDNETMSLIHFRPIGD